MLFSAAFYTSAQYSVVFVSDGEDKYTSTMTIKGHKMIFKTTTMKPIGSGSGGGDRMQAVKELKIKQSKS